MRFVSALPALALALVAAPLAAQSTPLTVELVASGFNRPLFVISPTGQTDRLFVLEQNAADVHVIDGGTVIATPFLDLNTITTVTTGGERGLLGLAFHPNYANNGFFYLYFTGTSGNAKVWRFTVDGDPATSNTADDTSGVEILSVSQPQSNHNGGCLAFGPDGMLWVATGDGGNANDTGTGHAAGGNAQSSTTLLGKMLRLDVDGGSPYAIPSDNPFEGSITVEEEIWAFGLRNPFRFSFDENGDLYIGDVGQDSFNAAGREEITHVSAQTIADVASGTINALNFGWRCREGFSCTGLSGCTCPSATLTDPVKDYATGNGAVIGGAVYRGDAIPDLVGTYFYADHEKNRFWSLKIDGTGAIEAGTDTERTSELDPPGAASLIVPASVSVGADGELYITDRSQAPNGEVWKIVPDGPFLGLGNALAGTKGDPILFGTGGVGPGEPGSLHLRNTEPNTLIVLFLGVNEGAQPFKFGILVPFPFASLKSLMTNGSGERSVNWSNLGTQPAGLIVYAQYGIVDAGGPVGVSLSNALKLNFP